MQVTTDNIRGKFKQILNSTNFADENNEMTMGTLCFNQFEPKDLRVRPSTYQPKMCSWVTRQHSA